MMQQQPYHLAQTSPWPLLGSISTASILSSLILWFNLNSSFLLPIPIMTSALIFYMWWRDVSREASMCGYHSTYVQESLEWGMILFIMSEVMFFSAFFWAFYHSSLSPTIELGSNWPPNGVETLNPFSVPLLNTLVLLASGATVTLTHNSMTINPNNQHNMKEAKQSLLITIILGLYFTLLQKSEYSSASFNISDSIFSSVFFVATGFHGLHVMIGACFLSTTLIRISLCHMSNQHHFGFEAAAWYWHFVDVVWIFLYINLYWWSSV